MTAQQDFQSRVDAVFGALDSSENPSDRWSLSETQVCDSANRFKSFYQAPDCTNETLPTFLLTVLDKSGIQPEGIMVIATRLDMQVYRPGKDADYSSEEEEAAKRDEATQEEVYPLLGLDGELLI